MNQSGDTDDLRVRTRQALLDALDALHDQLGALVLIGAQALYLHTGDVEVAIPEETKDADIGIDRTKLHEDPLIEAAIEAAGFHKDLENPQPGTWISPDGIPVDLMVPEAMAGPSASNRRGARIPPHDNGAMRRATGLEGSVVDNADREIRSFDPLDDRLFTIRVAGPGALLVAKLHKIGERSERESARLRDKDAHDVYRLLVAVDTEILSEAISRLLGDEISSAVTEQALAYLAELFAAGPDSVGSLMAGRAEEGVGEPDIVAASVSALASDLLATLRAPLD
ncbi:MAG TPA: hypothetical protein VH042_12760 [Solirubrobacterales bacterium]|jgi:hypothetical protein|nr:hypothetical protein [Solirubrobacterales bacterium]